MHDLELAHHSHRAWIGLQTKVPIQTKPLEPLGGSLTQLMKFKLYLVNIITSPYLSDVFQTRIDKKMAPQLLDQLQMPHAEHFEYHTKMELVCT